MLQQLLSYLKNKFNLYFYTIYNFNYKQYKWFIYILFVFIILIIFEEHSLYRLISFCVVLSNVIIYIRLLKYCENKWDENFFFNLNNIIDVIKLKKKLNFLIVFNGLKNIFLLLIFKIDDKVFDLLRVIHYKWIDNENVRLWLSIFLIN